MVPAELAGARDVVLASFGTDFEYGFEARWHWDLDHLREVDVDDPRQAMFVAVEGGRPGGRHRRSRRRSSERPAASPWLGANYPKDPSVAQLIRFVVSPAGRRQGLGHRLVAATQAFARSARYRVIYLYTNAKVPAALSLWESLLVRLVHDTRGEEDDGRLDPLLLEMAERTIGARGTFRQR